MTCPLIIELVGPSAVGKTTFAHALAAGLSAKGLAVALATSARPAERDSAGVRPGALSAPVRRAAKILGVLSLLMRRARGDDVGKRLLEVLTPESPLWTLRYRRYLAKLDRRWADALTSDRVVIFDQGFHSAAAALAALRPQIDPGALAHALDLIPKPDLAVRLNAPRALLAARLGARLGAQGTLERLFELDVATTLRQVEAFDLLDALLDQRGTPFACVACAEGALLADAVGFIIEKVAALRPERGR